MALNHLEDLKVFVQVVDSGTLAAAGRILGLPPPLVSRRLARLESALGVRLLQRTTRTLSITDEGRIFYRRCQIILSELDAAQAELLPSKNQVGGTIRVVLPSSMVVYGFMNALAQFLTQYPGLIVQVRISDHPAEFHKGGWDVATHLGPPPDSTYIGRFLCHLSPSMAATPEYLAIHGIPETPNELANHRCIRFGTDRKRDFWVVVDENNASHRVPIGGSVICEEIVSLYSAMCAGLGIGLLPRNVLRLAQEEGTLTEILPGCHIQGQNLHALIPAARHRLPRIQVFVDWFITFMEQLNRD